MKNFSSFHSLLYRKFDFNETYFDLLMKNRIHQVLLICSHYDAFILEEDGRIDEQIFNEYVSLNLRYPPVFIQAHSDEEAFRILETQPIDLVITMLNMGGQDPFDLANAIKKSYEDTPIVVLTPFSREVRMKISKSDISAIDYVFSWLGDADLLLAIIKLIEDKMNLEYDVNEIGVQTLILVEDSIRFYSSYLPNLYKIIFRQSKKFMLEGLNEHQQMMRMRGRPKVLLATSFEEAVALYEKCKNNLLGIISDFSYKKDGEIKDLAGVELCLKVKEDYDYLPFMLQSSNEKNKKYARELNVKFINKNSKTLSLELKEYINEYLAFGSFVFRDPETMDAVGQADDLQQLQNIIYEVPDQSLRYHLDRDHFSKWLNARALFPLAEKFKVLGIEDFENLDKIRKFLFESIAAYRMNKGRGIIAEFDREKFDEFMIFSRIGNGSIGGKARGLAFIDSLIKKHKLFNKYENVLITIPRTIVLTTDVFDEFMETNDLYKAGLSDLHDELILENFINSKLPNRILNDLSAFVSVINKPVAIRSSSLLEDSYYQPFAGVYSTYMIPHLESRQQMVKWLGNAIKAVYASVFYRSSKAYMAATKNVIDEEKMAIVLQEVCGNSYGNRFYPTISGVGRSVNFYPIEPEKPEDGIVSLALGLGKYVVEGGRALRFSPKYPGKILQLSTAKDALKETQRYFYALNLEVEPLGISMNDEDQLLKLPVKEAAKDGTLRYVASTYDFENDMLRDGMFEKGKSVVTFANYLTYKKIPLADLLYDLLKLGERAMRNPVEIEFAVNVDMPKGQPAIFNFLQIRPVVDIHETIDFDIEKISKKNTFVISDVAMGNGIVNGIRDVVYVKPESFDPAKSLDIALEIEKLNSDFLRKNENYILIGPGRWGSSDPWLGIPVKWAQISQARLIVESGLAHYRVDPSQGTHFFQNLTSFRVGYFTVNPFINEGYYAVDELDAFDPVFENVFIKHIHFDKPMTIVIDGKKNMGVVLKPGLKVDS